MLQSKSLIKPLQAFSKGQKTGQEAWIWVPQVISMVTIVMPPVPLQPKESHQPQLMVEQNLTKKE